MPVGEWTHLAFQFDGADKVVFVNGVETARGAGSTMSGHAFPVIIGGHGRDAADPAGQSFNGAIDEVRMYDEVLTRQQIMAVMAPKLASDSDGDGLNDDDEVTVYFTDPDDADSDDDGMDDGVEVANMLDPNSGDGDDGAEGDPDMDGLSNLDELEVYFTNPLSEDSDMDGSTDPTEIDAGTDPNDSSSVPGIDPGIDLSGLLLYYSFDLEDGVNVENTGTLETAGMISGGVTYGESKEPSFGTAFYGNRTGANDAYIQTGFTGTVLGLGPDSVYTAMAWVNWDGASGNVDHMVFGQEDGPGNAAMLHHGIRADSESNVHYGGWGNDLGDAGVVPVGEWTHLAFQFDGADKVVYLNGVETARGAGSTMSGHAFPVIIGGHGRDAADPAGQSFNGAIDEVKIYDEVLTAQQILEALDPAPDTGEDNENGGAGDGMDDGWEAANGLDPAVDDSAGNPDNDGLTNLEEWNGGETPTNPREADSDGDDLNDGEEVNTHGTNPNNADSDSDGLNDGDEIAANTEPLDADTDGDEMVDGYEVDNGHDPLLAADAAEDADNDGSLNLEECQRGTDPLVADTDEDGIVDGSEAGFGTDPLVADTDEDGVLDGAETTAGTNPLSFDVTGNGFLVTVRTVGSNGSINGGSPAQLKYAKLVNDGVVFLLGCDPSVTGDLILPDTIDGLPLTKLGPNAFKDSTSLKSVVVPETVTEFGAGAFYGCSQLVSVNIPEVVTKLGERTFYNCQRLSSIMIPDGIDTIESQTFYNCSALREISLPDSIATIGENAFSECRALQQVLLSKNLTTLGQSAFTSCSSLKKITIPVGLTILRSYTFSNCSSLTEVILHDDITQIEYGVFSQCGSLVEIQLPKNLTGALNGDVFQYCTSLKSIEIPDGITRIECGVFRDCTSLELVIIGS